MSEARADALGGAIADSFLATGTAARGPAATGIRSSCT